MKKILIKASLAFSVVLSMSSLSQACENNQGRWCTNERVIIGFINGFQYNYESTIVGVLRDGEIMVQLLDGRNFRTNSSNLARERGCTEDGRCVGDQAIISRISGAEYNYQSKIVGIFSNDDLIVELKDHRRVRTRTGNLAVQGGCTIDNRCVGDTVIIQKINGYNYNYSSKIVAIFPTGRVLVELKDGRKVNTNTNNLAVGSNCK